MPQFHETIYGRDFFSHQLPKLIKEIGRVADALEKQNIASLGGQHGSRTEDKEHNQRT